MLVAPLHVLGRYRGTIVEMNILAEPEGGALGVLGEIELVGQRQMVVEFILVVLDQCVMQCV